MIAIRPEAFRSTSCPNNKIVHTCGPFSPKGHATNAKLIICFLKKPIQIIKAPNISQHL